jgi:hypothetical protein
MKVRGSVIPLLVETGEGRLGDRTVSDSRPAIQVIIGRKTLTHYMRAGLVTPIRAAFYAAPPRAGGVQGRERPPSRPGIAAPAPSQGSLTPPLPTSVSGGNTKRTRTAFAYQFRTPTTW